MKALILTWFASISDHEEGNFTATKEVQDWALHWPEWAAVSTRAHAQVPNSESDVRRWRPRPEVLLCSFRDVARSSTDVWSWRLLGRGGGDDGVRFHSHIFFSSLQIMLCGYGVHKWCLNIIWLYTYAMLNYGMPNFTSFPISNLYHVYILAQSLFLYLFCNQINSYL